MSTADGPVGNLPRPVRLGYGAGSVATGAFGTVPGLMLLPFLTDTLGIGALAAGLVLGVVTEWSTLIIDARWKTAVGFLVLVIVLIVRPQGIFGRAKTI